MERGSFLIYRAFAEVMCDLSDEDAGRLFKALISLVEIKLSKNIVGNIDISRAMPPVSRKDIKRYFDIEECGVRSEE